MRERDHRPSDRFRQGEATDGLPVSVRRQGDSGTNHPQPMLRIARNRPTDGPIDVLSADGVYVGTF